MCLKSNLICERALLPQTRLINTLDMTTRPCREGKRADQSFRRQLVFPQQYSVCLPLFAAFFPPTAFRWFVCVHFQTIFFRRAVWKVCRWHRGEPVGIYLIFDSWASPSLLHHLLLLLLHPLRPDSSDCLITAALLITGWRGRSRLSGMTVSLPRPFLSPCLLALYVHIYDLSMCPWNFHECEAAVRFFARLRFFQKTLQQQQQR